jgi:nitrogen fixation protein
MESPHAEGMKACQPKKVLEEPSNEERRGRKNVLCNGCRTATAHVTFAAARRIENRA